MKAVTPDEKWRNEDEPRKQRRRHEDFRRDGLPSVRRTSAHRAVRVAGFLSRLFLDSNSKGQTIGYWQMETGKHYRVRIISAQGNYSEVEGEFRSYKNDVAMFADGTRLTRKITDLVQVLEV